MWDHYEMLDYKQSGFPDFSGEFAEQAIYWIAVLDKNGRVERWSYLHSCGDDQQECDDSARNFISRVFGKNVMIVRCTFDDAKEFANSYENRPEVSGFFRLSRPKGELLSL